MEFREERKISFISPIYNTEKYLRRCIDSVLNSIYKNFELILINDGSTDNSEEVCRYYCEKDCRVKLLTQKNCGVSTARNRGIDISTGEWIVFVDSDDIISYDFFSLITKREYQNQDLLIFDQIRLKENSRRKHYQKGINGICTEHYYKKSDMNQIIEKMLTARQLTESSKISLYSPYAKAYKKTILEQYSIRFPSDIFISEDKLFNIEYLLNIENCLYIPEIAYFVRWRSDSATHSFHEKFLANHYIFQRKLERILKRNGIFRELEKAYYENVLAAMTEVLIYGIFNPNSKNKYLEKCKICHKVRNEQTYKQAIKCNGITGNIPRKILLLFLNIECYPMVNLISGVSYIILRRTKKY